MTSKKKVDISKAPEEKKDLTKEFIQAYLEKNNTPENKEWLNDLYNKVTKEELGMDKVLQEKYLLITLSKSLLKNSFLITTKRYTEKENKILTNG